MFPAFLSIVLTITAATIATSAPQYLRSLHLSLPMDGRRASSGLPLDPTRQYEIEMISTYTLRPLLDSTAVCETTQVLFFRTRKCWVPVEVNGFFLPTVSPSHVSRDLGAYIVDPQTGAYYVPKLKMVLWGNGKPLVVNAARDFSGVIPEAQLIITDPIYREEQKQLARQEQSRQEQLAREQEEERKIEREALVRVQLFRQRVQAEEARQTLLIERQDRLQDALERQRIGMAKLQPHYLREQASAERTNRTTRVITMILVIPSILLISRLCTLRLRAYRDERRAAQQRAAQRWREQEERAQQEKLTREREEEAQREQACEAEVKAAFQKLEAECEQRLYETAVRLDLFPHYADPAFLQKAAATYQKSLLDCRDEIMEGHTELHEDRNFIVYLQNYRPDLYERAIWRVKALALAEQRAVEPPASPPLPAPRRRLTNEEHKANIERHREVMATWLRVKAEDRLTLQRVKAEEHLAQVALRLTLRRQFRAMLDEADDLDEDQKEQLMREFDDELDAMLDDQQESSNGQGFKRL